MPKSVTLENIIANEDPLANFNDGLAAGIDIMARRGWVKFNPEDESTYPPIGAPVVGVFKKRYRSPYQYRIRLVRFIEEGDGDGGYCWEQYAEIGEAEVTPAFWCPMPDPNDFG